MGKNPRIRYLALLLGALFPIASCGGSALRTGGGEDTVRQGVTGTLTYQGAPLDGAYVYAYRQYATNLLGPADFASDPSGRDGSYRIDLVEGTYYLVARKRASGSNTGPLKVGDLYTVNRDNPVFVKPGAYGRLDLDLRQMRDPMFFQAFTREETQTGIRGTIVNDKGNPVPWVFAIAYRDSNMKRIPDFTSILTDRNGAFVIYLPGGGRYWLAARKNIRERPVSGEPYGLYRESDDHSLDVPDGRFVEGVKITLEKYHKGIQ